MGIPFAVTRTEEFEHVWSGNRDDPPERQVKFRCRTLTGRERHEVEQVVADHTTLGRDDRTGASLGGTIRAARRACEIALVGWAGLRSAPANGDAGGEVKFPGAGLAAVEMLPPRVAIEIGSEVIRRSRLTEEASGN